MSTRTDNRKQWKQHINNYRKSNLSAKNWCKENQISYHALKYWITKFNKEKKQLHKTVNAIEEKHWIDIVPNKLHAPTEKCLSGVQVHIGQYQIDVAKGFDQDTLRKVTHILKQC